MSIKLNHMNAAELDRLHERLRAAFVVSGLKGDDLDLAIANAMSPSLVAIEGDRQAKADRKSKLRVVKD